MTRLLTICLPALLLLTGCGSSSEDGGQRGGRRGGEQSTPAVEAVQARYGSLPLQEQMSGTVEAFNQVVITPEIDAPVEAVLAQNGDYVQKGEPLVRLRDDVYRERVRQAEASLQIAQADVKSARANLRELRAQLKRTQRLAKQNFESQQQLESLKAQVAQAEAQVAQAKGQVAQAKATLDERQTDLRRTVIRAPISGQVGNRNVQVGQRVGPNTQLYTMGNLDSVRVEVGVTDRMLGRVEPGQTARVSIPSVRDTVVTAEVTRLSPFINNESYSAEAEIEIPNPGGLFKAGMFVQVDVAYAESQKATLVPLSAIYEDPSSGARGIFVAPTLGTEIPVETPDDYNPEDPPPLTPPTPTRFRDVEIVAEGQQLAGVRGIEPGAWVVTVGQNLLSTSADERVDARVRPLPWSRLLTLQRLQDTDLLRRIMKRQQRMAEQRFGESPDTSATDTTQSSTAQQPTTSPDTLGGSSLSDATPR
ncbi:MAG: efflux RND transporter periplasmic adaptor subunit [Salinibacter sp.]|uniref:efflux RND transporter periplasmic adaptor subunit n=1 Tax=Salinibacter sp. TaxID=2065818 RepID=UPI0035D49DA5